MKRIYLAVIVLLLLGVAVLQQDGGGAAIEISVDSQLQAQNSSQAEQILTQITGPEGFMLVLDITGTEVVDNLTPGRYFIVATAQGHEPAQAEVDLAEGTTESGTLTLEPQEGIQAQQQGGQGQQEGQEQGGGQQDGQQDNQQEGGQGQGGDQQ